MDKVLNPEINFNVNIRFLNLSKQQADALEATDLETKFGVHFKTKKITGITPLSHSSIVGLSEFIKIQMIDISDTDIFMSFTTEYDSRIINIPCFVNEAISMNGSRLVLSYTVE